MNIQTIPAPELGEKSIFEQLFQLIERHRLDVSIDFPLGDFYDIVSDFDMAFQKFNSKKSNSKLLKNYNSLLNYTIGNFLVIFQIKGFRDEPIFYAFKRFIAFFTFVLKEANSPKLRNDIVKNFLNNFPSLDIDISDKLEYAMRLYHSYYNVPENATEKLILKFETDFALEIGIYIDSKENQLIQDEIKLIVYCNDFIAKEIQWVKSKQAYQIVNEKFYMTLDIEIDSDEVSVEKLLSPLWLITSALEKITNVKLELEQIKKGSLTATIKIWMKDLVAKEETKAVFETTKEGVIKALSGGVSHADTKKKNQETKKNNRNKKD